MPKQLQYMIKIPIHLLQILHFCEYQIYLEYVKNLKPEPIKEMEEGKKYHQLLEKEHLEKAKIKLKDINDAISKVRKENIILKAREFRVEGEQLYGLIDEIYITPKEIIVIDDKLSKFPYYSNKIQVWGYCLAIQDILEQKMPIKGALRCLLNGKIIWQEYFSNECKIKVTNSINRILDIICGKKKPAHTTNSRKCMKCRFNTLCEVGFTIQK